MAPRDTGMNDDDSEALAARGRRRSARALSNALIARRDPLVLAVGDDEARVALRAARPASLGAVWIGIEIGPARAALCLAPDVLRRLTGGVEVVGVDPALLALLIEASLAPWLEAFEAQCPGLSVKVIADSTTAADCIEACLSVEAGTAPLDLPLRIDPDAAAALIGHLERVCPKRTATWLPLTFTARMGSVEVSRTALATLEIGDAIALPPKAGPGQAHLCRGKTRAAFLRVEARKGRVRAMLVGPVSLLREEKDTMTPETETAEKSTEETAPAPKDAPEATEDPAAKADAPEAKIVGAVGDIPVELDFDLGTVSLTVGDLDGLAEGQIFDLNTDPHGTVRISSGGRTIGHGEIVDLGGTNGVRVTRLSMAGQ